MVDYLAVSDQKRQQHRCQTELSELVGMHSLSPRLRSGFGAGPEHWLTSQQSWHWLQAVRSESPAP